MNSKLIKLLRKSLILLLGWLFIITNNLGSYAEGLIKTKGAMADETKETPKAGNITKDPWLDVRAFGAKGNGTTDDTKAIQAAVNSLADTGGAVLMKGDFVSGSITFPTPTQWIRMELDGTWKLKDTLTIPSFVEIRGLGGAKSFVQFSQQPQAEIFPPPGDIPTILIVGSGPKVLRNITISDATGKAILIKAAAFATLDNVSVMAADKTTSYPIVIDGSFWLWIDNSSFIAYPKSGPSILITKTFTDPPFLSGIIDIKDTTITLKGLKITGDVPFAAAGNMKIERMVYESGITPMFIFDSTNGMIGAIELERVEVADPVNVTSAIQVIGKGVNNIFIRNSYFSQPLVEGGEIDGLYLEGKNPFGPGWDLGSQKSKYILLGGDTIHGKWAGEGNQSLWEKLRELAKPAPVVQAVSVRGAYTLMPEHSHVQITNKEPTGADITISESGPPENGRSLVVTNIGGNPVTILHIPGQVEIPGGNRTLAQWRKIALDYEIDRWVAHD